MKLALYLLRSLYLAHTLHLLEVGDELQRRLEALGIVVLNPFVGQSEVGVPEAKDLRESMEAKLEWQKRVKSPEDADRLVERDLRLIRETDGLFAYAPEPSFGVSMEIFEAAKGLGKPVFIYTTPRYRFHPWLMKYGQIFTDLEFMLEVLELRNRLEPVSFRLAIGGKMGTGKSTCADFLVKCFGFKKYSFAAKLKEIATELFGMKQKDRVLLQSLGTDMRKIRETVWVDYVLNKIEQEKPLKVVIDDMRYLNEATRLREHNFVLIKLVTETRVQRERKVAGLSEETLKHPSEVEIEQIEADYVVDTSESIEDCYRKLMQVLRGLTMFGAWRVE